MPRKTVEVNEDPAGRRRITFEVARAQADMIEEMLNEQKITGFRLQGLSELCRQALYFYYRHGAWKIRS